MCGLCGVLGADDHWTDAAGNPEAFAGRALRTTRRQERLARAALANRILGHYGLKLEDWQGTAYLLRAATGRTELVDNLASLWPAAERLSRRRCDPLDAALIARLEGP